ncbi:arginine N-succinyltransferase [Marinomonas mediterranea]|uniref:arginine N-succinyltransferase n=1 Tax=Marinomonas mediterranea TaxID=119864 RepID=UPI0023491014|nr:arginine N-succinyltransferase [Marinomonas mediterranea]WCN10598.1 arginine N-succinyltransferase [Marinomonas mediterranea]WCN14649.1 arginine N-succinyltransferase [Marinomonas mediterranea]
MYIVRPADFQDLPALERLAQQAGIGFTNFPANRDRLNDKIASSKRALQTDVVNPGSETYLFVLVDESTGDVVGTSGLEGMVGIETPFYSYRIDDVVHASPQLQIHNRIPALFLCHDYSGTSRMMAMILDRHHQNPTAMSLLSRARLLFIAKHPDRFTQKLFVELRGDSDKRGYSPFWESLGKHFFGMDFKKADYLSGVSSKHFIADLMPRYPIYVPTLSKEAQDVIGVVHEESAKTSDLLLDEGFEFRGYVDIFDAGPTVEARTRDLRTIREHKSGKALITPMSESNLKTEDAATYLVAAGHLEDYRVTSAQATAQVAGLSIDEQTQSRLSISSGSRIQWTKL